MGGASGPWVKGAVNIRGWRERGEEERGDGVKNQKTWTYFIVVTRYRNWSCHESIELHGYTHDIHMYVHILVLFMYVLILIHLLFFIIIIKNYYNGRYMSCIHSTFSSFLKSSQQKGTQLFHISNFYI